MLVVSHDRYFLDKVTNRTLELFHGTVDSYPGNFTPYWRQKAERLEVQRRTYEKQQDEIAKTEDFIRRNHYGELATQAEDRRKKLERIERVPPPREIAAPPMGFPAASRTGDIVLRVEHLAKGVPRQAAVPRPDRSTSSAARGGASSAPTAAARRRCSSASLGELAPDAGRIILGTRREAGLLRPAALGPRSGRCQALDAVRPPHKEFIEQQRRDLLARFGVTGDMVLQKVGSLSGGERSRTALARLAASDANFLMLDEPTNHLDLWARDALEAALREFDGTVLFVSHDRYFLNQVATKLLVVEPGRFRVIDGNYDTYPALRQPGAGRDARAAWRRARAMAPGQSQRATRATAERRRNPSAKERRKRKFPYRKVPEIEAEIAEREGRIEALHELFADEAGAPRRQPGKAAQGRTGRARDWPCPGCTSTGKRRAELN